MLLRGLFPIVWLIKNLRETAKSDGKVAVNLMKLMFNISKQVWCMLKSRHLPSMYLRGIILDLRLTIQILLSKMKRRKLLLMHSSWKKTLTCDYGIFVLKQRIRKL